MDDRTLNARLSEARARIEELPEPQRGRLMKMLEETRARHYELKDTFSRLDNAVFEWQMIMKYIVFDREATRRERDALRRRLDDGDGDNA